LDKGDIEGLLQHNRLCRW